jgi:F-type H+-transporting ATPase subunit gamma
MTRRRNLEHHRHSLAEIRDIMNSMKTLAYLETRKLGSFLDAQHTVLQSIEEVAADLLSFYPEILPEAEATNPIHLLIGTERGFCGDFNHALLTYLASTPQDPDNSTLIAIGRKLNTLMEKDTRVAAQIDGASIAEEVTSVLTKVVSELTSLQEGQGMATVFCLYHCGEEGILLQKLLPPFAHLLHQPRRFPHPPDLNLSPREFLVELIDHYLFATLHEMLYTSLMTENRQRVTHLERAVKHLDDESADLTRQCNALRQEEIIEEIEVILLSATGPGDKP